MPVKVKSPAARRAARAIAALVAAAALCVGQTAQATSILRDTEFERVIRAMADPIFTAAGLSPQSITIYLLDDPEVNAFVAEGQNMFIHTGLILKFDSLDEVLGVMAHETGHIAGGHIVRRRDAVAAAQIPMLLSVLGAVAAVALGAPEAAIGAMGYGQQMAQKGLMAFTRTQESSADQAALTYLERTHRSPQGLLRVMNTFAQEEAMSLSRIDPYLLSHPVSRERIAALEDRAHQSPYFDTPVNAKERFAYDMIRAKLRGYVSLPQTTLNLYPLSDTSAPARYARTFAYFKQHDFDRALLEIRSLIAEQPKNPFFYETEGQILVDSGRAHEGIEPYKRAVALAPDAPLLHAALGNAYAVTEDPALMVPARDQLLAAVRADDQITMAWGDLATVYESLGEHAMANLATAEQRYSIGDYLGALQFGVRAQKDLKPGTVDWQRATDIVAIAQTNVTEARQN